MPILAQEPDIYPADLFEWEELGAESDRRWWALYTLARREKELMRQLRAREIPHYGPMIPKRYRSPGGRLRQSFVPLFPGYVFIYGDNSQRYDALTTNCVSRYLSVADGVELTRDLHQFYQLILAGVPLTPEERLEAGDLVRVRRGILAGIEGVVLRREGRTRLLVAVNFLQRGASLVLDDADFEVIGYRKAIYPVPTAV
jgi:transcription antitermination factor NusG